MPDNNLRRPGRPSSPPLQSRETASAPPLVDMRSAQIGLAGRMTEARRERVRLQRASWAFTSRRVPRGTASCILPLEGRPRVGDLVLARVDALGQHPALQLVNGRRRHLFPGDEIVVAYGNRYASNQFEATIPETLGPCHLVAGGGLASRARSWHASILKGPTEISPIGLLGNSRGGRINLSDFALKPVEPKLGFRPTPIAVVGTSMDSGKTQTAVHLVRGLIAAGLQVGYAKITGTGAGGDYWWLADAGANPVLDFTDLGLPSTYLVGEAELQGALSSLVDHLAHAGVDAMLLEIADGVLQTETAALLRSRTFERIVGGIVLAAQDSMGALAGVNWLDSIATPVLAISGVVTAAPLQVVEAREATELPIYDRGELATAANALRMLGRAQHHLDSRRDGFMGVA